MLLDLRPRKLKGSSTLELGRSYASSTVKGLASEAICVVPGSEKITSISCSSSLLNERFMCLLIRFDPLKEATGPNACNRRRMAVEWAKVTAGGEMITRAIEVGLGTFFTGMMSRDERGL